MGLDLTFKVSLVEHLVQAEQLPVERVDDEGCGAAQAESRSQVERRVAIAISSSRIRAGHEEIFDDVWLIGGYSEVQCSLQK